MLDEDTENYRCYPSDQGKREGGGADILGLLTKRMELYSDELCLS